jgi:uncharacterized protein
MTHGIVRWDDVSPQPWKNGGGITRDLLTWPSAQAWGIRISVADIERDGPFSHYGGIERLFAVLEGNGVTLAFDDDGSRRRMTPADPPLRFDGGRAPHCTLIDGVTRDLNVLFVPKRGNATCSIAVDGEPHATRASLRAVYVHGAAQLERRGAAVTLPPRSLAWSTQDQAEPWRVHGGARAFWIDYRAAP